MQLDVLVIVIRRDLNGIYSQFGLKCEILRGTTDEFAEQSTQQMVKRDYPGWYLKSYARIRKENNDRNTRKRN